MLRGGDDRRSPRTATASLLALLALLPAACGESGVADNATVSIYLSAPLCSDGKRELKSHAARVRDLRVRAVCVDDTGSLAAIGAAARRATEDSSSVAYVGTADANAARFSEPILEAADLPRLSARSGAVAIARLLRALRRADDSGSLREALSDELR